MVSNPLMPVALFSGIQESEVKSNPSFVVGDGGICCGRLIEGEDRDESGFSGWSAGASPWMVIVANVATETPRHMTSEGLSGDLWRKTRENLFEA
jgi:hypothetical protein